MKTKILLAVLLAAASLALYWPATRNGFVFDDHRFIVNERNAVGGVSAAGLRWAFESTANGLYQPVTRLTFLLDYQFFGASPRGRHAVGVLLHAANAALLFLALAALTGAPWRSAAAAALWAVHPANVETVAWCSGRADLLALLFGLLALLAWAGHLRRRHRAFPAAATGCFLLAALSKSIVVSLPFLLLLLDYWPLGRLRGAGPDDAGADGGAPRPRASALVLEKAGPLVVAAGLVVASLLTLKNVPQLDWLGPHPVTGRMATVVVCYAAYLGKVVWPADLACFYPHRWGVHPAWQWAGATALLAAISAGAAVLARRLPMLAVGWLWYLVALLPVIGVVQTREYSMADRYLYLPLVGLLVAAVWGWSALAAGRRVWQRAGAALAVALVLAALPASRRQLGYWRDDFTLFSHALAATDGNWMAYYNVGVKLHERGEKLEAARHYAEAIRINPGYAEPYNNLGLIRQEEGRAAEAEALFRRVIELKPEMMEPHLNLGRLQLRQGRAAEAAVSFAAAVRLRPDLAELHASLGGALLALGRRAEAAAQFREALGLDPANAEAAWQLRALSQQ